MLHKKVSNSRYVSISELQSAVLANALMEEVPDVEIAASAVWHWELDFQSIKAARRNPIEILKYE